MSPLRYTVRRAEIGDAGIIAYHRVSMFAEMGEVATDGLGAALLEASRVALAALLADDGYVGWVATDRENSVVAGAGAHIKPQLPRMSLDGARVVTAPVPLVVNVYTEPSWRNHGIARVLMEVLMEWAAEHGFDRLVLHASHGGRSLYQSLGFVGTNEMRWAVGSKGEAERASG